MNVASRALHDSPMTEDPRKRVARRLRAIRTRHAETAEMSFGFFGGATVLWCDPQTGQFEPTAEFAADVPREQIEYLGSAYADIGFLLNLIDRSFQEIERLKQRQPATAPPALINRNYATQAAIKCGEPLYIRYLEQGHSLEPGAGTEAIEAAQRAAVRIQSKKELNTDAAAQQRWLAHCRDFEAWRQGR